MRDKCGKHTSYVLRGVQRDGEDDSEDDEDRGDDALEDIGELELAQLDKVVADPAELRSTVSDITTSARQETYFSDGEYGAKADTDDEHEQEDSMQAWVSLRVENRQQEEAEPSDEGPDDRKDREHPLSATHLCDEAAETVRCGRVTVA